MNTFFLFNNLHFALEILGALAFFMVAWLALDAFLLKRDFLTALRGFGFSALAIWQIFHAFGATPDLLIYFSFTFYIFGLLMVLLSLILERSAERLHFEAVFILPAVTAVVFYVNFVSLVLYLAITYFSIKQYRRELKASLKPFWMGFLFLSANAFLAVFYGADETPGLFWILGHLFEVIGFGSFIFWVWQYLQLRIREEMILIFTSAALLISIVVTFAFSIILVNQIEETTKVSLLANVGVLDLAISRFKEEAMAKTKYLVSRYDLKEAISENDFSILEKLTSHFMEEEKLGFLLITNKEGGVILRAHALTQKEDNLSGEAAVGAALGGKDFVTIESSPAEKFSIRAAAPIKKEMMVTKKGKTIVESSMAGVLVAGFLLDNAFIDNIKRITGLEVSILDGDTVVATTLLNPDGRTRAAGIKITDQKIISAVLGRGEELVLRTEILSRPVLAGYLPLRDADGKIVGMISSIKPQQEILTLANTTNRLTLITVAILMLILTLPIYFITKRLSGE